VTLHIWEVECANCGIIFHMFVPDGKKPNEGISCINCKLKKGRDGILVASDIDGRGRVHFGWDYDPEEYIPSMIDIEEQIEEVES
jgi:hypothetical protein